MAAEYMTATEAIGWVATRDETFASSLKGVTANRLALLLASRKDLVRKPRAAANVLVQRCAAGRIVAQGRKGNARVATSDRRERVVEAEWPGLSLINLRLGRDEGDGAQFHDVVFRRKDVIDCFPPIPHPVQVLEPVAAPTAEHEARQIDVETHPAVTSGKDRLAPPEIDWDDAPPAIAAWPIVEGKDEDLPALLVDAPINVAHDREESTEPRDDVQGVAHPVVLVGEQLAGEASASGKKGSEAEARRAWELELSEVQAGTRRRRSQKKLEAEYAALFHVSRPTIRSWIVGTRRRGRPGSGGI